VQDDVALTNKASKQDVETLAALRQQAKPVRARAGMMSELCREPAL